jgi:fumarate reductase subunit C
MEIDVKNYFYKLFLGRNHTSVELILFSMFMISMVVGEYYVAAVLFLINLFIDIWLSLKDGTYGE